MNILRNVPDLSTKINTKMNQKIISLKQLLMAVAIIAAVSHATYVDALDGSIWNFNYEKVESTTEAIYVQQKPVLDPWERIQRAEGKRPTVEEVRNEVIYQSQIMGVDVDLALRIAQCESGFDYDAKNPTSTARGVYQWLIASWEGTESAKRGYERNNYVANIREFNVAILRGELWRWEADVRSENCWKQ